MISLLSICLTFFYLCSQAQSTSYGVVYYYSGSDCNGALVAGQAIGLNSCYPSGDGKNSTIATVSSNTLTITIYLSTSCSGKVLKTETVSTTCSSFVEGGVTGTQILQSVSSTSLVWPSVGTVTRFILNLEYIFRSKVIFNDQWLLDDGWLRCQY